MSEEVKLEDADWPEYIAIRGEDTNFHVAQRLSWSIDSGIASSYLGPHYEIIANCRTLYDAVDMAEKLRHA